MEQPTPVITRAAFFRSGIPGQEAQDSQGVVQGIPRFSQVDAHGYLWQMPIDHCFRVLSYLRACIAAPNRQQVAVVADRESYFVTPDALGKLPDLISMNGLRLIGNALECACLNGDLSLIRASPVVKRQWA